MQIKDIEPKFEELEKGVDGAHKQIGGLEQRLEQIAAQLQEHERATITHAHTGHTAAPEAELTGDEEVFKAAADDAEVSLPGAVNAIQEAETPNVPNEAEEVVEKAAAVVDDAMFPKTEASEPEPEEVGPVATVEVVVSGDLDPNTAALLERLKYVDTDLVKVTVDKRE